MTMFSGMDWAKLRPMQIAKKVQNWAFTRINDGVIARYKGGAKLAQGIYFEMDGESMNKHST